MSVARAARALGVTLSELFSGLEAGESPTHRKSSARPVKPEAMPIRVGRNAIRIEKLIEELRHDRDALRTATRELNRVTSSPTPNKTRVSK